MGLSVGGHAGECKEEYVQCEEDEYFRPYTSTGVEAIHAESLECGEDHEDCCPAVV